MGTKNEIIKELEAVRDEIATKNAEKEQLQSDINKAVAMEQYEEAGKLAPKKKKLILQTQELEQRLKEFEQMIEECEEEEEDEQNTENEDPNGHETSVEAPGHNGIIQNEDEQDQKKEESEESDQDKDEENMFGDM